MFKKWKEKTLLEKIALIVTFLGITIIVLFLLRAWYDNYIIFNEPLSLDRAANIGDFIGGLVGVLFTLVGVFLLIETLSLQRSEFSENRKAFNHQVIENHLFNLLQSQRDILSDTKYNGKQGRAFFSFLKTELKKVYDLIKKADLNKLYPMEETIIIEMLSMDYVTKRHKYEESLFGNKITAIQAFKEIFGKIDKKDSKLILTETYWIIFYKYHNYYGHYFRHLYHILKYIFESEQFELKLSKTTEEKEIKDKYRSYADLVQATLSSDELLILFFNGLCFNKMKLLLHTYDFLENLPIEDLFDNSHSEVYKEFEFDGKKYPEIKFKSMDNKVS